MSTMKLATTNDFHKIILDQIPLIDVRAPIEFNNGSFINATNLPIMNDEERHLVGICYKEQGNAAAVTLGHQLVSGDIKEARINAWASHLDKYPDSMMYCFRGGSRSQISQQWIKDATGKEITRLEGGYKAFRHYIINLLEPTEQTSIPVILGGYTGSGKTILLRKLENAIDLEAIAHHRGSSFGQHIAPQPTQINFENNLAYALVKHQAKGYKHMILEDEGRNVGTNFLPLALATYFSTGNLVVLEAPLEERIQITLDEYVVQSQAEYIKTYSLESVALQEWFNYITSSMHRVKKRLGGDRFKQVLTAFEEAFTAQLATGSYAPHEAWIKLFLDDYYDPMYRYQLEHTTKKIVFRGNRHEVLVYLKTFK